MFPFVHNLGTLRDGLENQGLVIPDDVQDADQLSIHAVQARYPGLYSPTSPAEFAASPATAEVVVAWAESFIP